MSTDARDPVAYNTFVCILTDDINILLERQGMMSIMIIVLCRCIEVVTKEVKFDAVGDCAQ